MTALDELRQQYEIACGDADFQAEFRHELKHYVGRPSPIYHAKRWSELGGADLSEARGSESHWRAQDQQHHWSRALLARRMAKTSDCRNRCRVSMAWRRQPSLPVTAWECVVYMGSEDVKRQAANVYRMKLLGATVVPVGKWLKNLKDALNEAMMGLGDQY